MRAENPSVASRNKHQLKSEATRQELMEAAEKIFVRDGYAGAQIDAIAQETGRTKGAVYAQFKSKEDLFLSLLERRIRRRTEAVLPAARQSAKARVDASREQYLDFATEDSWTLLLLEFKLHAYRNRATAKRVHALYERSYDGLRKAGLASSAQPSEVNEQQFKRAVAFLRAIPGAIALERCFEPTLEERGATDDLLRTIFDAVHPTAGRAAKTRARTPRW